MTKEKAQDGRAGLSFLLPTPSRGPSAILSLASFQSARPPRCAHRKTHDAARPPSQLQDYIAKDDSTIDAQQFSVIFTQNNKNLQRIAINTWFPFGKHDPVKISTSPNSGSDFTCLKCKYEMHSFSDP
jgi:hypothetical protein